jgi:hypothetical protein
LGPRKRCKPTKAEIARQPASPFGAVRLVAGLPLVRPKLLRQRAIFAVYQSRGVGACFDVVSTPAAEQLACLGTTRCAPACLGWFVDVAAFGLAPGPYTLLWGLLPARADRLRVHEAGRSVLYAVTGPAAPRFPGRRVFMADLGRHPPPTSVEVIADGRVFVSATRRQLVRGRR